MEYRTAYFDIKQSTFKPEIQNKQRLGQILTNFGQNTPTSEGCCEPPSGRIFVPFSPKFLGSDPVLGNLGENPFL